MKHAYLTIIFIFLVIVRGQCQSSTEVLVNKIYEHSTGQPDTLDWSDSDLDPSENLIVCGNTLVNGQGTNLLLTKYDSESNLLWQKTFNNSNNGNDYGVTVKTDNSGNIFVACASFRGSTNDYDYNILKYNSSGTLQWQTYYNGTGSSYDIPTAMVLDASGNIYVTGTSVQTGNLNDYLTIKFNSSGTVQWTTNYDYVHLSDIPGAIELSNNRIIVSGGSSNSISDWDFTTLKYNISNGSQVTVSRSSSIGAGFDFATAITKDANGNFYLTGKAFRTGTGYDIKTIKLDTSLSVLWTKYYDLENSEDGGWDIEVDGYNDIYVTGFISHSNGNRDMITIKYNDSGTEQWHRNYIPLSPFTKAESRKISISPFDAVYITGFQDDGTQSDVVTISYDLNGNIRWLRNWIGSGGGDDIPSFIKYDVAKQRIYITARTWTATQNTYENIWYEEYTHTSSVETQGSTQIISNEVIVKFDPSLVSLSFVNNKDLSFEEVENVIDANLLSQMRTKTGIDFASNRYAKILKIFTRMTSSDTVSVSRSGETIKMEKFWRIFVLTLPPGSNEQNISDSLNKLYPSIVYAEKDGVLNPMNLSDDDYLVSNQASLVPTSLFTDAHINLNSAWDSETGSSAIKVGVIDDAVYWAHEDFGDGTFAGSKIADGYDYWNNVDISQVPEPDIPHGTAVAGIIGALRNNNLGIAGIAGGDVDNDNNPGCALYSLDIVNEQGIEDINKTAAAIVEGSSYNPYTGYGYGLNIETIQSGRDDFWQIISDAVKSCYDNHCIFVASRGNGGAVLSNQIIYPACLNQDWVINVGSSGNDGFFKQLGINGDNQNSSLYGNNIDLLAPGSLDIVLTTMVDGMTPYGTQFSDQNYTAFTGTSAAAPHVAGVAALALSKHRIVNGYPNDLDDVDVQVLLKKSATDLTGTVAGIPYTTGSDIYSGSGLLNAGSLMQLINAPTYWIQHNSSFSETQSTASNLSVYVPLPIGSVSAGYYNADRIQVVRTYQIPIAYNSTTAHAIDHWLRHAQLGYSSATTITDTPWSDFQLTQNGNTITVTITTYLWHITTNILGQTINKYVPFSSSTSISTDFSLHMYDANVSGVENVMTSDHSLSVYPNPTSNSAIISFNCKNESETKIEIVNLQGECLKLICIKNLSEGLNSVAIDVSNLANGIYFIELETDKIRVAKLIVNHQ